MSSLQFIEVESNAMSQKLFEFENSNSKKFWGGCANARAAARTRRQSPAKKSRSTIQLANDG
jgi:hypothetical protein